MDAITFRPPVATRTPQIGADAGKAARRGMLLVLIATVAWSFGGLFTRSLTIDIPTAVAWRSFAGGALLGAVWLVRRRANVVRDVLALRWYDWFAVAINVVAQGAFSVCLFLSSVAHVAVIYASMPFVAALIAWWWLRERVAASTLIAIAIATLGIVTVVAGSRGSGSLVGDALAVVMTVAFAMLIVLPKAYPDLRVADTMCLGSFINFGLFLPFSHTCDLDLRNATLVSAYGFFNLVLGHFLFVRGARVIPAATAGLIVTLEIGLSPFWVWLFIGERVDAATLVGGAIVFGAVVGHLLHAMHRAPVAADAA